MLIKCGGQAADKNDKKMSYFLRNFDLGELRTSCASPNISLQPSKENSNILLQHFSYHCFLILIFPLLLARL